MELSKQLIFSYFNHLRVFFIGVHQLFTHITVHIYFKIVDARYQLYWNMCESSLSYAVVAIYYRSIIV